MNTLDTMALPTQGVAASRPVHPLWLRICHWLNVVAVVLLVTSGWRIYNAAPFFDFSVPRAITLGGWLGGAIQWHFAAMWLLAGNGLIYLTRNTLAGRWRERYWPIKPVEVLHDLRDALSGRLAHADLSRYNAVQKLAYLSAVIDLVVLVLSGLVLWKSVQFPLLRELMGGYEAARRVHFFAMAFLCTFVAVHVAMVALVPRTLRLMVLGR